MNIRTLINFNESQLTVVGVNIHTQESSQQIISYCILKNDRGYLRLLKGESNLVSLDQLDNALRAYRNSARVHINFTGKGVLFKNVDHQPIDHQQAIQNSFPYMRPEELSSQLSIGLVNSWVTLIRNEQLEPLNRMDELGYTVYAYSLGPFILDTLASTIHEVEVSVSGYFITFDSGRLNSVLVDHRSSQGAIRIGDTTLDSDLLISYAAACAVFMLGELDISPHGITQRHYAAFQANQKLFSIGKLTLVTTLILLVINTVAFFWLDTQVMQLESKVDFIKTRNLQTSVTQIKNVKLTQTFESIGWRSNILPLVYADQLAATIPTEITLTLLEIGTLDENKMRQERMVAFYSNLVLIKGNVTNPAVLAHWINELEHLNWITEIFDQRYDLNSEDGLGTFEFKIRLR